MNLHVALQWAADNPLFCIICGCILAGLIAAKVLK